MAKNEKTQKTGRIAATIAELKQVSWPDFPSVLRKLGSVLAITGMFLLVFMGMDALLKWMYSALIMGVVGVYSETGSFIQYGTGDQANVVLRTMSIGEMIAAAIVAAVLVMAAVVTVIIIKSRNREDY